MYTLATASLLHILGDLDFAYPVLVVSIAVVVPISSPLPRFGSKDASKESFNFSDRWIHPFELKAKHPLQCETMVSWCCMGTMQILSKLLLLCVYVRFKMF